MMLERGLISRELYEANEGLFMDEFENFRRLIREGRLVEVYDICRQNHSTFIRFVFCVHFGVYRFVSGSMRPWFIRRVLGLDFTEDAQRPK